MVKELINLLSQSSKLDEITVKHYLKLMKLDKLPKFFITNYIKSHSLGNFLNWLLEKDMLLKHNTDFVILPPYSSFSSGLSEINNLISNISENIKEIILSAVKNVKSEILVATGHISASKEESEVISSYSELLNNFVVEMENLLSDLTSIKEQIVALSDLLNQHKDTYVKFRDSIFEDKKNIDEASKAIKDYFAEQADLLKNELVSYRELLSDRKQKSESSQKKLVDNIEKELSSLDTEIVKSAEIIVAKSEELKEKKLAQQASEIKSIVEDKLQETNQLINSITGNSNTMVVDLGSKLLKLTSQASDKAIKLIEETLNIMGEANIRVFGEKLADIEQKFVNELKEIESNLSVVRNSFEKKVELLRDEMKKSAETKIENIESKFDKQISEIKNYYYELASTLEKLKEKINEQLKTLDSKITSFDAILSKETELFSNFMKGYAANIRSEKTFLIDKLKEISEGYNELKNMVMDSFQTAVGRLKGAIGRIEDLYNLKSRQIYKTLSEIKRIELEKLDESIQLVQEEELKDVFDKLVQYTSTFDEVGNVLKDLSKKVELKFAENKGLLLDLVIDDVLEGLDETKKEEIRNRFNALKTSYNKILELLITEIRRDIDSTRSIVDTAVNESKEDVNKFINENIEAIKKAKDAIKESFENIVNEYNSLIYENVKESIMQIIIEGENALNEEKVEMGSKLSEILNKLTSGMTDTIDMINSYYSRLIETLNTFVRESLSIITDELNEAKQYLSENLSAFNELSEKIFGTIGQQLTDFGHKYVDLLTEIPKILRNFGAETNNLIDNKLNQLYSTFYENENKLLELTSEISKIVHDNLGNILDQITDLQEINKETHLGGLKETLTGLNENVKNEVQTTVNQLKSLITNMSEEIMSSMKQKLEETIREEISYLETSTKDIVNAAEDIVNWLKIFNDRFKHLSKNYTAYLKDTTSQIKELYAGLESKLNAIEKLLIDMQEMIEKHLISQCISISENIEKVQKTVESFINKEIKAFITEIKKERKRFGKQLTMFEKNLGKIKNGKDRVDNILKQYTELLLEPLEQFKKVVSMVENEIKKTMRKNINDLRSKILNLSTLSQVLLEFTKKNETRRTRTINIISDKELLEDYIKSFFQNAKETINIILPTELAEEIMKILETMTPSAKIYVITNASVGEKLMPPTNSIKVEKVREPISNLVIIADRSRVLFASMNKNYAIDFEDPQLLETIIVPQIKNKYGRKIKI